VSHYSARHMASPVTTMKAANLEKELPVSTFQYYAIFYMEAV
jgi:hypothetical protein